MDVQKLKQLLNIDIEFENISLFHYLNNIAIFKIFLFQFVASESVSSFKENGACHAQTGH
jgi:hypothetical protein